MKILLILTVLLQISTYNPEYQFKSTSIYRQNENVQTESPIYNTNNFGNNSKPNNKPRKVSGLDGWAFWLLWGEFNGVPSSASNEDLFWYYDYIQNGGTLSYNDWWNQKYSVPVGDVIPLILIGMLYFIIKLQRVSPLGRLMRDYWTKKKDSFTKYFNMLQVSR